MIFKFPSDSTTTPTHFPTSLLLLLLPLLCLRESLLDHREHPATLITGSPVFSRACHLYLNYTTVAADLSRGLITGRRMHRRLRRGANVSIGRVIPSPSRRWPSLSLSTALIASLSLRVNLHAPSLHLISSRLLASPNRSPLRRHYLRPPVPPPFI
ncbi:hypothetical protein E2C01_091973 [Portunus trituberculatus]|uniref:Uncharacterized protein n=1 Tax=Portunus trituberculatus TaxID=210409 RepID=A0A5B7JUC5_PORTR|nr:hypothetical protein [Portunus trituberculatus]